MKARRRLFNCKNAYDTAGNESVFLDAMKENCIFQYKNCALTHHRRR